MEYSYEIGDRVRLSDGRTGTVESRVPGNGRGDGWYTVGVDTWDGGGEVGPVYADELSRE